MAYRSSIVGKYYATRAALLTDLFSEIEAMGWTLHDDQSGSSYKVYKSNGEAADQIYQYLEIYWVSANIIYFMPYYKWDATAHAGNGTSVISGQVTTSEAGFYAWIYGDKNLLLLATHVLSTYYLAGGGFPNKKINSLKTALTSSATSGSSVTITVNDTTGFVAGDYYQIVGANDEGRDMVVVSSITDGTHMVIASLPRNYSAGALIGISPLVFGSWGYVVAFSAQKMYFGSTCPWSAIGLGNSSYPDYFGENPNPLAQDGAPDSRLNYDLLKPIFGEEGSAASNSSWHTFTFYQDARFLQGSRGAAEDVYVYGVKDSGTAESSGSNTLTDADKAWTTDQWVGKVLIIKAGTGIGQIRKIASNTGTQITITTNWATLPDATSQYYITEEAYRCIQKDRFIYAQEGT